MMDDGYQRHRDGVEGFTKTDTMVWLMCSSGSCNTALDRPALCVVHTEQTGWFCMCRQLRALLGWAITDIATLAKILQMPLRIGHFSYAKHRDYLMQLCDACGCA